jgi:hypothetical protein
MVNPARLAIEPQLERDEDALDRETSGDREDSLTTLYHALRRGDESAADNAKAVGEILRCMVDSARRGDVRSLTRWHDTCQNIVRQHR